MNKVLLLLLFIPFLGRSQDLPLVDDKILYEEIIEFPNLSKSELYGACKRYVANAFKSAKNVIQTEDESTGLIICKGNVNIPHPKYRNSLFVPGITVGGIKSFTMQFENKDGRCRVRIYDIFEDNSYQSYGTSYSLEYIMFDLAKRANNSKGKTKEKRKKLFDESVYIVNNTFYGLIESLKQSVRDTSIDDNW